MDDAGPNDRIQPTPRQVRRGTLIVLVVAAGFYLIYSLQDVLLLLFAALVLAMALRPPILWAESRGLSRTAAVWTAYGLLVLAFTASAALAVPLLADQASDLAGRGSELYARFRRELQDRPSTLLHRLGAHLPATPPWSAGRPADGRPRKEATDNRNGAAQAGTTPELENVSRAIHCSVMLLQLVVSVVAVLLMSFNWSLHEARTSRAALLFFPPDTREEAREVSAAIQEKVGAYVRGQGILCLWVGGMSLLAYWWIGIPYAFMLAVLAGIVEAIPFFGPTLGAVPAVLMAIPLGSDKIAWVIAAAVLVQQLENHLLVPRVMSESAGVNPVVTLLAIAAFGTLFGLLGAILAIPLGAVVQLLLDRYVLGPSALNPPAPAGRDGLSRLRYSTREIIRDVCLQGRNRPEETETDPGVTEVADLKLEEEIEAVARLFEQALVQLPDPVPVPADAR